MALQPGLTAEYEFTVDDSVATDVAGSLGNRVLATPRMIGMMERASMKAVWRELPDGTTCVGYEVCVKHIVSAPFGATCTASAELSEIEAGRKLRFDVRVICDGRTIGVGTHERRVISAGKFDGANAVDEPSATLE